MLNTNIRPQFRDPSPRAQWRQALVSVAIVTAWLSLAVFATAQVPLSTPQVSAFLAATHHYAEMHRRLEQQVGQFDINTPIESINRMIRELATAIRAERQHAGQGDLFTPALTAELRMTIARALRQHGLTPDDVREATRVDRVDYSRVELRVNDAFPWVLGVSMFPCLLDALPTLPAELQYRIVGDDLLLIDVHASLVVDIMRSALAKDTSAER